MSHLVPCPGCARHVRASDSSCPFCSVELPEALRASAAPKPAPRRLGRAAIFTFGATLAASVAGSGCGGSEPTPTADPQDDVENTGGAEMYGGPPADDGTPPADGQATDPPPAEPEDGTQMHVLYGGPPSQ